MKRLVLIALALGLSGCLDASEVDLVRNATVARICRDGAVILEHDGRFYRFFGGRPKAYSTGVPLSRTCIGEGA